MEVTNIEGFICNRSHHWFAIRKINNHYWNLNSMKERPEKISHFRLAAEIDELINQGYSVFCVVDAMLPLPCTSDSGRERGLPQYWWKEEDLISGKTNATTGATDPWRSVGTGMRLDGASVRSTKQTTSLLNSDEDASLQEALRASRQMMSEDEMIQMAMEASLAIQEKMAPSPFLNQELKPEPAVGEQGAVRIQFRLPDGSKVIRRFLKTDSVAMVYLFVEKRCGKSSSGKTLELRAGFPPKVIPAESMTLTIEEAKLSGELLQGRYVR